MTASMPMQSAATRLPPMRLPSDSSPRGLAHAAHLIWSLNTQSKQAAPLESGNPLEEYKSVCEFMRLYATLRFYQLALLLGTTGSIITALSSTMVRASFVRVELLRAGGLIISLTFLVMELRASTYWHVLRRRGNELAQALSFQGFPVSSRWNPLSTSGASFYLHCMVAALWLISLFLHFEPM